MLFDHAYVINLDRQPERFEAFEARFRSTGLNAERVAAVDGAGIDQTWLDTRKATVWPFWTDPFLGRLMTTGEVGCLFSHRAVWERIARREKAALVLEDDAVPVEGFAGRLSQLQSDIGGRPWDLLYLGHKQLETVERGSPTFIQPGYTYWTVAYVLTPEGARKLLSTPILKNMIPVDEFLPAMFGKHPNPVLQSVFADSPRLGSLAAWPALVKPAFGENESQTERSTQVTGALHIVTVASDPSKAFDLTESLKRFEHEFTILGPGEPWRGGDMSGRGGGQKINLLREHLDEVSDDRIVLFVDGYDVVVNGDPAAILTRYAKLGFDVVFAAEKTCWPDRALAEKYPDVEAEYRYLNSGAFIGRADAVKQMLRPIADDADDQLHYTEVFLSKRHNIALDAGCTLFQTVSFAEHDIVMAGRQIRNSALGSIPVVLHGNGGEGAKSFYADFVRRLSANWESLGFSALLSYDFAVDHNNQWSVPATDILQLTFWTPEFCQLLIDTAEAMNEWQALENDKVPGQELRVLRISPKLFDNIKAHYEWRVVPWLEQVWHPFFYKGIKDLFIIKYASDCQLDLALHNDLSHVSASVKLNNGYTGGVLEFPRQRFNNAEVPVGTMLVWPSSVTHPHRSTAIRSGAKYSMTFWTNPE